MKTSQVSPLVGKPLDQNTVLSLHCLLDAAVAVAAGKLSLTNMVLVLLPLLRTLGIAVLRCIIEHRDQVLDRNRPQLPCRGCATVLSRTRNVRQTNCYTLFGKLIFNRRNYLCPKCKRSEYPVDWSLKLLDRCAGHSDEFASVVVLLTTLLPNAKAMCLFHKCFGFEVSTQLARTLSFEIGHEFHCQQADRAEPYWKLRSEDPENLEPVPAVLRQMPRKQRMYFMLDDSKLGIQQGARGRGAKKRVAELSPAEKALRKALQEEKRKAVQAAKKAKPGPDEPAKVPKAVTVSPAQLHRLTPELQAPAAQVVAAVHGLPSSHAPPSGAVAQLVAGALPSVSGPAVTSAETAESTNTSAAASATSASITSAVAAASTSWSGPTAAPLSVAPSAATSPATSTSATAVLLSAPEVEAAAAPAGGSL